MRCETHILLIEDDAVFRQSLVAALSQVPHFSVLASASNCAEARALLQKHPCDVLLLDLGLPDGSGLDLIAPALALQPDCQIVITTVLCDESNVLRAIEAGAVGYLLKDHSPQVMAQEIDNLRKGGSPISPLIARQLLKRIASQGGPAASSAAMPHAQEGNEPAIHLSARETQVLQQFAHGFTHDEIANNLQVSRHTVQTFVRRIYQKLQVGSKVDALNAARKLGLIA